MMDLTKLWQLELLSLGTPTALPHPGIGALEPWKFVHDGPPSRKSVEPTTVRRLISRDMMHRETQTVFFIFVGISRNQHDYVT